MLNIYIHIGVKGNTPFLFQNKRQLEINNFTAHICCVIVLVNGSLCCLNRETPVILGPCCRVSPECAASVSTSRPPGLSNNQYRKTVRQPSVIQQDEGVGVATAMSLPPRGHSFDSCSITSCISLN